jgi:CheY-like chemotaxis protein
MWIVDRRPPHVLVSDIGMAGEDGYALIRALRARPRERGGAIPAIALTAFARPEDRARALAAGYQAHLAKPLDAPELVAAIADLARAVV